MSHRLCFITWSAVLPLHLCIPLRPLPLIFAYPAAAPANTIAVHLPSTAHTPPPPESAIMPKQELHYHMHGQQELHMEC